MSQHPQLVYSTLGKRIYIVTRYQDRGEGRIVAERKYDVTDQFQVVLEQWKIDHD